MKKKEDVLQQKKELKEMQENLREIRKRFKKTYQIQHNVEKEIDMHLGGLIAFPEAFSEKDQERMAMLLKATMTDYRKQIFLIKRTMVTTRKMLKKSKKS